MRIGEIIVSNILQARAAFSLLRIVCRLKLSLVPRDGTMSMRGEYCTLFKKPKYNSHFKIAVKKSVHDGSNKED